MRSKIFCIDWKVDIHQTGVLVNTRSDGSLYSVTIGAGYSFLMLVFSREHSICYR